MAKRFRATCIDAKTYTMRYLLWDGNKLSGVIVTSRNSNQIFSEGLKRLGYIRVFGKVSD